MPLSLKNKAYFIDISTRIPANLFAGEIVPFSKKKYAYPYAEISYLERRV
jgi:hypothetical protein